MGIPLRHRLCGWHRGGQHICGGTNTRPCACPGTRIPGNQNPMQYRTTGQSPENRDATPKTHGKGQLRTVGKRRPQFSVGPFDEVLGIGVARGPRIPEQANGWSSGLWGGRHRQPRPAFWLPAFCIRRIWRSGGGLVYRSACPPAASRASGSLDALPSPRLSTFLAEMLCVPRRFGVRPG